MNTHISIAPPVYQNIITKFSLYENTFLPDGLVLDETTGAITGTPTSEIDLTDFTILGSNPTGTTMVVIQLMIRKGECKADGNYPKTVVDEIAVYECSSGGSYIGTQKRSCLLGTKYGEWQKVRGICMPISVLILLIVLVVIIVIFIITILIHTRKGKSVGNVKGRKSS